MPRLLRPDQCFVEGDFWNAASSLLVSARTGVIHQNAPHQLCGDGKEVRAVLPVDLPGVYQSQVGFVDERSRLQRVTRTLSKHVPPSQAAQLLMDQRKEFFQG